MGHIKNIITGVLSGAVLFFAVQVGVAKENVAVSDKVEVKASVGESYFKEIEKSFISDTHEKILIEKKSISEIRESMQDPRAFTLSLTGEIDDQNSWTEAGVEMCEGDEELCGITFDAEDYNLENGKPSQSLLNFVEANWQSAADGEEIGTSGIFVHLRE